MSMTKRRLNRVERATYEVIDEWLDSTNPGDIISCDEIYEGVLATGCTVDNWWTVRNVMAVYLEEEHIRRTYDLYVEEYKKL